MTKPARLFAIVLLYCSLLLFGTAQAQPLHQATATITYTPIATRTATPVPFTSTTYTLSSGNKLLVENRATMGETLVVIVLLCVVAVLVVRWAYDLAYQWGK